MGLGLPRYVRRRRSRIEVRIALLCFFRCKLQVLNWMLFYQARQAFVPKQRPICFARKPVAVSSIWSHQQEMDLAPWCLVIIIICYLLIWIWNWIIRIEFSRIYFCFQSLTRLFICLNSTSTIYCVSVFNAKYIHKMYSWFDNALFWINKINGNQLNLSLNENKFYFGVINFSNSL